jgi:3'-phosphoadenosine 5'-phosphosulfate sulfotransferase (PAPS reductase)/FAD synthetase
MKDFFSRHQKVGLLFSAGKDSLACLLQIEKYWDKTVVIWGNPGNPYPETVEYMEGIKKKVPHFVEVKGNQKAFIAENGYPVDVLPVYEAIMGTKLIPFSRCCATNLWGATAEFVKFAGLTGLVRGQKTADEQKSPARSGMIVDGVEFLHPLENWTDGDVLQYLGERVPDSYKRGVKHSLDCMNCTAYASPSRMADLWKISPETAREVRNVHAIVVAAVAPLMENYGG